MNNSNIEENHGLSTSYYISMAPNIFLDNHIEELGIFTLKKIYF